MLRALIALICLLPTSALGLSCMPSNFAKEFNRIAEAPEPYWIGYGALRQSGPMPETPRGQPFSLSYEFTGQINFRRGDRSEPVRLEASCAASWCGKIPAEATPVIVFLEHKDETLVLNARPCGGDILTKPSLGQVSALRACLKKGHCDEEEISAFE